MRALEPQTTPQPLRRVRGVLASSKRRALGREETVEKPGSRKCKEVEFSTRRRDDYRLYRVYAYDEAHNSGRLFVVSGSVEEAFGMTSTQYRVVRS